MSNDFVFSNAVHVMRISSRFLVLAALLALGVCEPRTEASVEPTPPALW